MTDLTERLVNPFYLHLMRESAPDAPAELVDQLVDAAQGVDRFDLNRLLRGGAWREVVMGAWLSLSLPDPAVSVREVTDTLSKAAGDLTIPPLTAAALVLIDELDQAEAAAARDDLARALAEVPEECAPFAEAARARLGAGRPGAVVEDRAAESVTELVAFATALRSRFPRNAAG